MLQQIQEHHEMDEHGHPTGGQSSAVGITVTWQEGPLGRGPNRKEPNGAFVEGVLQVAAGRLRFYQSSKFSCRENALALTKIEEALHWLESRTNRLEFYGIKGTYVEDSVQSAPTIVGHE